jgi:predicted PurR-regulated permease PerM
MARMVSFVVLLVILLVIAGLFFRVMANFLLPMFLALLLVVMFGPLHRWFIVKCRGRDRLAAGLTTASILLIFLVPMLFIVLQAVWEGVAIYHRANQQAAGAEAAAGTPAAEKDPGARDAAAPQGPPEEKPGFQQEVAGSLADFGRRVGVKLSPQDIEATINRKVQEWIAPVVLSTAQFVAGLLIGLFVMVISLYYFLADGPWMIRAVMRLSPLDDRYEEQLIDQFENISRAVVLASVASAVAQGLLAGVGYYFAGLGSVFLLTVLTMLFAMVPFVGAAAVWVPVCLYLFFFEHRPAAAIVLAVYGTAVVSAIDNVIKPIILHGRSNLHPLLALLSVLGGVQALGPIGIFVGPMVVAFLHALLNMLHTELAQMGPKAALAAAIPTAGASGPGDPPAAEPARATPGPARPESQP